MKNYCLAILLALPLLSTAQSNYKSGLVTTNKGDTLRGFINYKEWGRNPTSISFKTALNDNARELGLQDINYFEIDGMTSYREFKVGISLNPIDISSPPSLSDTTTLTEPVFLKILNKGKNVTLYAYTDAIKTRYYISDNNTGQPAELIYGVFENPDNQSSIITKNTFRYQLNLLVRKYKPGSDKLILKIQQSDYNADDLIPVIAAINGETETVLKLQSKGKAPIKFYAGGAFISSTLSYSANGPYYGARPSTSNSPKIAIGVEAIANPDVGHLIFRMELAYTQSNYSINATPNPLYNIAEPTINSLKLKQSVIFLTPQVIYNIYNANLLKVFVDLGYSINIASYQVTNVSTEFENGAPISTNSSKGNTSDANLKGYYSALQFKAGVLISKKFEIYGAYFPDADITNSLNYTSNLYSFQVGLNYFLGKTN